MRFGPELSVGAGEEEFIGDQPVQCSDVGAELCGAELFLGCDDGGMCITDESARHYGRYGFGHGTKNTESTSLIRTSLPSTGMWLRAAFLSHSRNAEQDIGGASSWDVAALIVCCFAGDGRLGRSPHTLSACLEFADEINSFFRASSAGPCLSPS